MATARSAHKLQWGASMAQPRIWRLSPGVPTLQGLSDVRYLLIATTVVILAVAGWWLWSGGRTAAPPPESVAAQGAAPGQIDRPANGRVEVAALGRLEPTEGVRQIGALPGERLGKLLVRAGDEVAADAELAYLDSRPLRQAERDLAAAQLEGARSRLEAEKAVARARIAEAELALEQARLQRHDISSQEARVGLAEANHEGMRRELARVEGLSAGLVAPQELDQKRLLERQAREELRVAVTLLEKLRASIPLAERAAAAQLEAAQASARLLDASSEIESLEQQLRLAQTRLDQSVIRAPLAGQILEVLTRSGEMIGQRPILQMADLEHMQVAAEVYETDIGQVRIGQPAVATSRALPTPLRGKVVQIGSIVSANEVQSLTASAPSAQRVVKVLIELDEAGPAARLINLQVDVQFLAGSDSTVARASP